MFVMPEGSSTQALAQEVTGGSLFPDWKLPAPSDPLNEMTVEDRIARLEERIAYVSSRLGIPDNNGPGAWSNDKPSGVQRIPDDLIA